MQPKINWRVPASGVVATRAVSWFFSRILPILDMFVFRKSSGRQTVLSAIAGIPSFILTTKGVRSGEPRSTPLLGIPDGGRFIIIAANWGQKHHPGWYYNLHANPNASVSLNGETRPYIAREVIGTEREQCWNKALQYYKGYNAYRERVGRKIHVFVLEPGDQSKNP